MARQPGEQWTCECGEKLIAARTLKGSVAPITVEVKTDGNVWLGRAQEQAPDGSREVRSLVLGGPLLELAREQGMGLHLNHFANCPAVAKFRRKRRG